MNVGALLIQCRIHVFGGEMLSSFSSDPLKGSDKGYFPKKFLGGPTWRIERERERASSLD